MQNLLALALLSAPVAAQADFQLLDVPVGFTNAEALDVSNDGTVLVGRVSPNFQAFRWTAAGGYQLLGLLPGIISDSSAQAVSGDGRVVVGWGSSPNVIEAFRWEAGTGMVHLPALGGLQSIALSSASAIDRTGALVGGYSYDQILEEGTLWPAGQAPLSTGFLAPGQLSAVEAIADDVPVAVGWSTLPGATNEATIWDSVSGLVSIGVLPGYISSFASVVSRDGTRVLGTCSGGGSVQAFAWSAGGGMSPLGSLPGGAVTLLLRSGDANATSFVGAYTLSGQTIGFYGSPATGIVGLGTYLTSLGATVPSVNRLEPEGMSADGNVIVGTAWLSGGLRRPFIARLAPIGGALLGADFCGPSVTNSIGLNPDLEAFGSDLVTDNDVTLFADDLPPGNFGLFIVSAATNIVPNYMGGVGTLCLAQPIGRLGAGAQLISPSGTMMFDVDLNGVPQPGGPVVTTPGMTWTFQTWYRDGAPGANFTSARRVPFQ